MPDFETLDSRLLHQGRVFQFRQDDVRLPDGQVVSLDIVAHNGGVTLVPVDAQGRILLVRQYRHPARQHLLELPAGALEPGEPPQECARREIREETGMAAEQVRLIGEFFLAPGYSTEYMYIYLATGLSPSPLPGDEDEFIEVQATPVAEIDELIASGQVRDAKTILGLLLAKKYLGV